MRLQSKTQLSCETFGLTFLSPDLAILAVTPRRRRISKSWTNTPVDEIANRMHWQTNDVEYQLTSTTFTKTSRLPIHDMRLDGTPFTWFRPWNHERITNEAEALLLVSRETAIPVPKLIRHGTLPDGRRYLVTESMHQWVVVQKYTS